MRQAVGPRNREDWQETRYETASEEGMSLLVAIACGDGRLKIWEQLQNSGMRKDLWEGDD